MRNIQCIRGTYNLGMSHNVPIRGIEFRCLSCKQTSFGDHPEGVVRLSSHDNFDCFCMM